MKLLHGSATIWHRLATFISTSPALVKVRRVVMDPMYVAIFGFFALSMLGGLMYFTYNEFEAHNRIAKQNTIVMVGQLEPSVLRAEAALNKLQNTPDDPEVLKKALLETSLLISRFGVIETHLHKEDLLSDKRLKERWAEVSAFNPALRQMIETSSPVIRNALVEDILANSEDFTEAARKFSIRGMQVAIHRSTDARLHLSDMVTSFAMASLLLIACLSILTFVLALSWKKNIYISAKEHASRDRLQKIYDFSSEGILVVNQKNIFVMANPYARRLFGMTDADLNDDTLLPAFFNRNRHFASPKDFLESQRVRDRMNGGASGFLEQSGRVTLRTGKSIYVELRMTEDYDLNGDPVVILFLRDISAHIEREEDLRAARDEAVQAVSSRSRFYAAMSHEMRTPISAAIAALDAVLTRTTVNEEQEKLVQIADQSAKAALDQINNVLDLAWLERGAIQNEIVQFNLVNVIEELVDRFRPLAASKGTSIELDLPEHYEAHLSGALRVLMRPLNNLLSNAMKYTIDGVIFVRAGIHGNVVRIEVEDTGTGIAEGVGDRIFDPFDMGESMSHLQSDGTGLGLAIAKRAVESLHGEIGYRSRLGTGTLFWFTARFDRVAPQLGSDLAPHLCDKDGSSTHEILIVEDNEASRLLAREMLEWYGHKVSEASNGLEGSDMAMATCYDVILMDVNMPVMGGLEATKRIREKGESKASRIIGVTAFSSPDDIQHLTDSGMDIVLPKPITSKDIDRIFEAPNKGEVKTLREFASIETLSAATTSLREEVLRLVEDLGDSKITDCTKLSEDAHRTKGLAAMLDIKELSNILGKVEQLLSGGELQAASDHRLEIERLVREHT